MADSDYVPDLRDDTDTSDDASSSPFPYLSSLVVSQNRKHRCDDQSEVAVNSYIEKKRPQTVTEFCDTASDNDNIPARNMIALQPDLVSNTDVDVECRAECNSLPHSSAFVVSRKRKRHCDKQSEAIIEEKLPQTVTECSDSGPPVESHSEAMSTTDQDGRGESSEGAENSVLKLFKDQLKGECGSI